MEPARLLLGMVVAIALPMSVPPLQGRRLAAVAFTGLYAAYAILPILDGWRAAVVWLMATLAGQGDALRARNLYKPIPTSRLRDYSKTVTERMRAWGVTVASRKSGFLFLLPILVASAIFYGSTSIATIRHTLSDHRIAIVLSGLLLAVFVGNELVALVVRPHIAALGDNSESANQILPQGLHLGWIERALVFVFVAGGQADAAALAVAAKSLARLPALQRDEGNTLGQYVIVGTLTSTLIALVAGVVVRLSLGLSAL